MFDANARGLKRGTMFFASKGVDLLYCEMLDNCSKNPSVMILKSYGGRYDRCLILNGGEFQDEFGFMPYEGYFENGELHDFIHEEEKEKAKDIISGLGL